MTVILNWQKAFTTLQEKIKNVLSENDLMQPHKIFIQKTLPKKPTLLYATRKEGKVTYERKGMPKESLSEKFFGQFS